MGKENEIFKRGFANIPALFPQPRGKTQLLKKEKSRNFKYPMPTRHRLLDEDKDDRRRDTHQEEGGGEEQVVESEDHGFSDKDPAGVILGSVALHPLVFQPGD